MTDDRQITFSATLEVDEKWASNMTPDELTEYLKARLDYALGFRGHVRRLKTRRKK
jgi:hypothetical protein